MTTSPSQARASLQVSGGPAVSGRNLPLLVLGSGADPGSERGVECPGELPPASDPALVTRARKARAALGDRVFILGHHYQRDEVIQFADVTGDSHENAEGLLRAREEELDGVAWVRALRTSIPAKDTSSPVKS